MGEIPDQMVSVRILPWHKNATVVDDVLTAREAMVLAGLDWNVEARPIFVQPPIGTNNTSQNYYVVEGQKALVRLDTGDVMQVCSDQYVPVQNYQAFDFFDKVVESGEAKYETAGPMGGGRIVFMTAKVPDDLMIGGVDLVEMYIMLATSHDGTMAFTIKPTPVRVVCRNTLNLALAGPGLTWRHKHDSSLEGKAEQAQQAIGLVSRYTETFQREMDELIAQDFTKREFEKLVTNVFPTPARGYSADQYAMIGVFESSPTMPEDIRYTKWGALNAVREWRDWGKDKRGSDEAAKDEARLKATWFGKNVADTNKVYVALRNA